MNIFIQWLVRSKQLFRVTAAFALHCDFPHDLAGETVLNVIDGDYICCFTAITLRCTLASFYHL